MEEIPSEIWRRSCSSIEVQLQELFEYLFGAKSSKVTIHGVEPIECGFDIQLAKEVLRVLLICVEGDEGDVFAVLGLLPA